MLYNDLYTALKDQFSYDHEGTYLTGDLTQYTFDFHSRIRFALPEEALQEDPPIPCDAQRQSGGVQVLVNKADAAIEENLRFRYPVLMPSAMKKARNLIIMFHGFNEKHWHKYLPWAVRLAHGTGRAVLLFPIAFHMNRAPALWNDSRAMNRLSKERKERFPAVIGSSLSNVAISTRLHNKPERFIWSGLESYHDVIDLVEGIKRGEHPVVEAEAGIDFCSYSIGTFLGEILMMTNKNGYFSKSRYATFCGGPVFNRLSPVSKFIVPLWEG